MPDVIAFLLRRDVPGFKRPWREGRLVRNSSSGCTDDSAARVCRVLLARHAAAGWVVATTTRATDWEDFIAVVTMNAISVTTPIVAVGGVGSTAGGGASLRSFPVCPYSLPECLPCLMRGDREA